MFGLLLANQKCWCHFLEDDVIKDQSFLIKGILQNKQNGMEQV